MVEDAFPSVRLHNVAELTRPAWADDGWQLHRAPADVRANVNVAARDRLSHPTGCELRTVPTDGTVEVTLSAAEPTLLRVFWGPFQVQPDDGPIEIGTTPTTIRQELPPAIANLDPEVAEEYAIDPRVCRLRFEFYAPVAVHNVGEGCRRPRDGELPDGRLLAYGTSITEGANASAVQLGYVSRVARRLGVDALNLGAAGSAFCEPAIADHIADREWNLATLAISVNMANRGFTVEQFRDRARNLVHTVAEENPERPVAAVTLFPYHADLESAGDRERARAFREGVRDAVTDGPENAHLLEGPELMDSAGLTTDLLHPGDAGMIDIGRGLAGALEDLRE